MFDRFRRPKKVEEKRGHIAGALQYPSTQFLVDMEFPSLEQVEAVYDGLCRQMQHIPRNSAEYELCREYGAQIERWGEIQMELMQSAIALVTVINSFTSAPQLTEHLIYSAQQTVATETQKINALSEESIQMRMSVGAYDAKLMVANIALKFLQELGATLQPVMLD